MEGKGLRMNWKVRVELNAGDFAILNVHVFCVRYMVSFIAVDWWGSDLYVFRSAFWKLLSACWKCTGDQFPTA